jgi:putative hydrolase of the HAD superfamily
MAVRAVLLDAFGTIIHPEPGWEGLRNECLAIVHGSWAGRAIPLATWLASYEQARAEQHAHVRDGLREFDFPARFARSMGLCGVDEDEARAWGALAHEKYHRFQHSLIHAYDAPAETLARLKREGHKLALVSNYAHTPVLRDALTRLGLAAHFDALVVSADVGYLKPHPRIFEAALDALDVGPEESVMVGNDITCDIEGAKKAGLRTVWTPYPRASPAPRHPLADAVLERLSDLPDAIRKL